MASNTRINKYAAWAIVGMLPILCIGCPLGGKSLIAGFTASTHTATPGQAIEFEGNAQVLPPLVLADDKFRDPDEYDTYEEVYIVSYRWDFGDGAWSQGQDAVHAYAVVGTYTVCLTVTLSNGDSDITCQAIVVEAPGDNNPPEAVAKVNPVTISTGLVALDGSDSSDPDGDVITYEWSFVSRPAGSAAALSNANTVAPTFVADKVGDYVVRLVVRDESLSDSATTFTLSITNVRPVAVITGPGTYTIKAKNGGVSLSGENSYDPDGAIASYAWSFVSKPAGSETALDSATNVTASFTPDVPGAYIVELVVTDNLGVESNPAQHTVTASIPTNHQPVAVIDGPSTVSLGYPSSGKFNLSGVNSSDPDGDTLSYAWILLRKPENSMAAINSPAVDSFSFQADAPGEYEFQLIVNDGQLNSEQATHVVTVDAGNQAPTAAITGPTEVNVTEGPQVVALSGANSSDPEGDALSYAWELNTKPTGSAAALAPTDALESSFTADLPGEYTATLRVFDGINYSPLATHTVTASRENRKPVAVIEGPTTATMGYPTGGKFSLNGLSSSDPDGDALSYAWMLLSRPEGSSASIGAPTADSFTFVPDAPGVYEFQLIVNDGQLDSAPDTHAVTVEPGNRAPTAVITGPDSVDITEGPQVVSLSGVNSSDPDGDALLYTWELSAKPEGSAAVMSPADTMESSFTADVQGEYIATLMVFDGINYSPLATHSVMTIRENQPPTPDAGQYASFCQWQEIRLVGSAEDPEGDAVEYSWYLLEKPEGSRSVLNDNETSMPTFVPDQPGTYRIELTVWDEAHYNNPPDSVYAEITITQPQIQTQCVDGETEFRQGASSAESEFGVAQENELPAFWTYFGTMAISPYEATNCQYAHALNYALGEGLLTDAIGGVYTGGDVYYNGWRLIQLEGGGEASEWCDIEYDTEMSWFYIPLRNEELASNWYASRHPVVEVSWYGALAFCNWWSEMDGYYVYYDLENWVIYDYWADGYRLPTESEWEYCAGWKDDGHWLYGISADTITTADANFNLVNPLGLANWPFTTPVGYYSGVSPALCYDMSGNVWEWVEDEYNFYVLPTKAAQFGNRVIRGGSWLDGDATELRVARREPMPPDANQHNIGFRVARDDESCYGGYELDDYGE